MDFSFKTEHQHQLSILFITIIKLVKLLQF